MVCELRYLFLGSGDPIHYQFVLTREQIISALKKLSPGECKNRTGIGKQEIFSNHLRDHHHPPKSD